MGGYTEASRNNPFLNQNGYNCNVGNWFQTNGCRTNAGEVIATMAPQMLFSIFSQISAKQSDNTSSKQELRNPDEIKGDIQEILNKYDIDDANHLDDYDANISDIKIQLEQKKSELVMLNKKHEEDITKYNTAVANREKAQKELAPLKKEFDEKTAKVNAINEQITTNNNAIDSLGSQITKLQGYLNDLGNTEDTQKERKQYQDKINDLTKQKEKLENENKKLGEEAKSINDWLNNNKGKIETLTQDVDTYTKQVQDLEKAIKPVTDVKNEIKAIEEDLTKLDNLKKELKKAEGKDAIEALTNDDTEKISKLVTKLRKAQASGDQVKISQAQVELKTAINIYMSNPENVDTNGNAKNKTIEMLRTKIK